jgi:hypothetical protein
MSSSGHERRRVGVRLLLVTLLVAGGACAARAEHISVRKVEAIEGPETLIKIHLSAPLVADARAHLIPKGNGQPDRLAIDLPGADLNGKASRAATVGWGGVRRMRLGTPDADTARLVLDLDRPVAFELASDGNVLNVTLRKLARPEPATAAEVRRRRAAH